MRICSITPHQLLNNPRVVREADALAAAGHDVRVVAVKKSPADSVFDDALAGGRWRLQAIDVEKEGPARAVWLLTGARQKAATALWRRGLRTRFVAGLAGARTCRETIARAVSEPADLVIAHTQPMLIPAIAVAYRLGCAWGFDCEDLLSEEFGEGVDDPAHKALLEYEESLIKEADYVTVASPAFAPWLNDRRGVRDATYVANVLPRDAGPEAIVPGYPGSRPHLSLYWFSISIGPSRGLEDAVKALPLVNVPVQLHVRGRMLPAYADQFRALLAATGTSDRVFVHDIESPDRVVHAAASHDVGLVLLQPCCVNHELAVPNKLYTYMLAGLAVGATATTGLKSILDSAPDASFLYPPGDHAALAARINALVSSPDRLLAMRQAAFDRARRDWNWDVEQRRMIALVERTVTARQPAATVTAPARA